MYRQYSGHTILTHGKHIMLNPQVCNETCHRRSDEEIVNVEFMELRPSHKQSAYDEAQRDERADVPSDLQDLANDISSTVILLR